MNRQMLKITQLLLNMLKSRFLNKRKIKKVL